MQIFLAVLLAINISLDVVRYFVEKRGAQIGKQLLEQLRKENQFLKLRLKGRAVDERADDTVRELDEFLRKHQR